MLAFTCDNCGQLVFFENTACLNCGSPLGVVPDLGVTAFRHSDDVPGGLEAYDDALDGVYRRCANADRHTCNWVVDAGDADGFCRSCLLTRTAPADDDPVVREQLIIAETAKRRLIFQLDHLGLPIVGRAEDPEFGLAFDLLSSRDEPVTTGHQDGVVAIDLAESDDVHREGVRQAMGEAYRTMLGHMRHEIGHYYWMVFARDEGRLARIRRRFGDDTLDYGESLDHHYHDGPPQGWEQEYVSAYATTHPWEDFAETFAHYLHIRGTLQTAAAYGMIITGPTEAQGTSHAESLMSIPDDDVDLDLEPFETILAEWLPLTYTLNELNRAMGKRALYPFVLTPKVVEKLSLVHRMVVQVAREQEVVA